MDIEDVHFTAGLDPGGNALNAYIAGNQVGVGKLKPAENEGGWLLKPMPPFEFEVVVIDEDERHLAVEAAIAWLEQYFRGEGEAAAEATWGAGED